MSHETRKTSKKPESVINDTQTEMDDINENIIDNENIMLVEQLKKTLPNTSRANIAVGYFFISGFAEIMDNLDKIESSNDPNHVLRILISPTTNRVTAEALFAANEHRDAVNREVQKRPSPEKNLAKTKQDVKKNLEHMPQTNRDYLAACKIKQLVQKKKLQVKVYTREQLHAKTYIFEVKESEIKMLGIVGSSNLSISGIKEHTELNLKTTHSEDCKALLKWFNRHWDDESCKEFTEEIANIIDSSWVAKHTPHDVYGKALSHESPEFDGDIAIDPPGLYSKKLFDFQKIAVGNAVKKLDEYGGVMIADVVGIGKTLIGTAILKHLVVQNKSKPLIICPPHLIDMWQQYLNDYNIHGDAISRYKIGLDDNLLPKYAN